MYLNQFTNTKNSVQALSLHVTNAYSGYMLGKNQKIPSNSFSSTKMTWDILFHTLSASKMSATRCIIQKQNKTKEPKIKTQKEKKNHSSTKLFWLYSISTFAEIFTQN